MCSAINVAQKTLPLNDTAQGAYTEKYSYAPVWLDLQRACSGSPCSVLHTGMAEMYSSSWLIVIA